MTKQSKMYVKAFALVVKYLERGLFKQYDAFNIDGPFENHGIECRFNNILQGSNRIDELDIIVRHEQYYVTEYGQTTDGTNTYECDFICQDENELSVYLQQLMGS